MKTSTIIKKLFERPDNYKLDIDLLDEHWETIDKFDFETSTDLLDLMEETFHMRNQMLLTFGHFNRGSFLDTYVSVELRDYIVELIKRWKEEQTVN